MTDFDLSYAKEQILNKSDEELAIIANSTSDEYREEVINFAKEELQKRGAINISPEEAQEIIEQREDEQLKGWIKKKEKGLPIRWLLFYTYTRLPAYLIWNLTLIFIMTELTERVITLIIYVPIAILSILVIIGIHKRRIWGWKLNWVLLAVESILLVFSGVGTDASIAYTANLGFFWFLINYFYFSKRRILFS